MEFLIDNNISPKVADSLSQNGFGSVHVKELGMRASTDDEIFKTPTLIILRSFRLIPILDLFFPHGNSTNHQLYY